MSIISQKTWDNMPDEEKKKLCQNYSEDYDAETRVILEDIFGKENLQPKPKIRTWDDILREFPETYGNENIELFPYNEFAWDVKLIRKNIVTLKIAKLIELGYGGVVTDEEWQNSNEKFVIKPYYPRGKFFLERSTSCNYKWFIAFHTPEQREEFMSYPENRALVEQYYMI